MRLLGRHMLGAYYAVSLPYRRWWNRRAARRRRAPVMVVFYHRVADDPSCPWAISPAAFTAHVDWLSEHFELVSLSEAQQRLRHGCSRPSVSITFDDGYAENCEHALPLLIKRRIPCTYFVSTQHVVSGLPFPHDVHLHRPVPPNTVEQLRALAAAGIEIGAHTRTHTNLGQVDDAEQLNDEVLVAGRDLAAAVRCRVRYFAFPYGQHEHLNTGAFHLAREGGYEAVCSAYGGFNFPGDDPFHLQRIHADSDLLRLKNYLTVDPRKLRSVKRFEYDDARPVGESRSTEGARTP